MTTKQFIELPGLRQAYMATLTPIIPEYKPIMGIQNFSGLPWGEGRALMSFLMSSLE